MWFIPTETGREVKTWASNKAVKLLGQSNSAPWGGNCPPPCGSWTHSVQPAVSGERVIVPRMCIHAYTPHLPTHARTNKGAHTTAASQSMKVGRLHQPLKNQGSQKTSFKKERNQEKKKTYGYLRSKCCWKRVSQFLDSGVLRQRA